MTMRAYDVLTDTFVTDRNKIVDMVVCRAASMLTYSEANAEGGAAGYLVRPAADRFLRRALAGDRGERFALVVALKPLWRDMVEA